MTQTLDNIIKGLDLAKAKGCPVERIWINEATDAELTRWNGDQAIFDFRGHPLSVIRDAKAWEIRLECGWTDRNGVERRSISPTDAENEYTKPPAIDTAPMEAHPLWASFG